MSQNRPDDETTGSFGTGGGTTGGTTGTGGTSGFGGAGDTSTGLSTTGGSTGGGAATGAATAPATGFSAKAKEYGQTVADAASQAKDYIAEKASAVGDKISNVDYGQIANDAKDYARQNPGQALLIAAAAGFVIGLLVRGGRR